MPGTMIVVFLTPDGWAVRHEGRERLDHLTGVNKGAAVELARDMAQNEGAELVVLNEAGEVESREQIPRSFYGREG
ncbi:MAG TPA: DUF2188 domain-containing protein [Anaerolineaceae bacterium]|nr:DUF2188 domain-containing protein [Anaerolineaceae bacterium]